MATPSESSTSSGSIIGFLFGIGCWNLIVAIDSTALSTALPIIAHELNATSTQAFWCGTSFMLCSAAFQPVLAACSDALGRKPIVALSLLLFTAGAIICALAQSVAVLILGRVLQGAGGGGLETMSFVLMADTLALDQRHKAVSVLSLSWLIGPVLGPIISGAFTVSATWRAIFYFNLPFCALGLVVLFSFTRCTYKPPHTGRERFKHIPYFDSLLFVVSLSSFLVAISWGGTMFAWSAWQTLVPLILGLFGMCLWTLYSLRVTKTPLIPIRILNNRTTAISFLGVMVHGLCLYGILYYVPLFYQAVKLYSPIISGVALLPACLTAGPFAAVTGFYISKSQNTKIMTVAGWILFAIGLALLSLLKSTTSVTAWVFITFPAGIGIGILYGALALGVQASVETAPDKTSEEIEKDKSLAAGLNPFFSAVGQAFGIVISQAVFTNEMTRRLGSQIAENSAAMTETIKSIPKDSPWLQALFEGFEDSLKAVWFTLVGLAAMALLLTFFTKDSAFRDIAREKADVESINASDASGKEERKRKWSLFGRRETFFGGVHDGLSEACKHLHVANEENDEKTTYEEAVVISIKEVGSVEVR